MTHSPYLMQVLSPVTEPLTLAETKLYLRVDSSDEDTLIQRLISSARRKGEHYMRRSLITQSWRLSYDSYAPARVNLLRGPAQAITMVQIVSRDGTTTTVGSSTYRFTANKESICFDITPVGYLVEITYTAGYGSNASDVPDQIKQGLLSHIASMYGLRDGNIEPDGIVKSLYDDYRSVIF